MQRRFHILTAFALFSILFFYNFCESGYMNEKFFTVNEDKKLSPVGMLDLSSSSVQEVKRNFQSLPNILQKNTMLNKKVCEIF